MSNALLTTVRPVRLLARRWACWTLVAEAKPEILVDLDAFISVLVKHRALHGGKGGMQSWWRGWLKKKTRANEEHQ